MEETVFSLLHRNLHDRKMQLATAILSGNANDFVEYARMTSKYAEVQRFEEEIKELESRFIDQ